MAVSPLPSSSLNFIPQPVLNTFFLQLNSLHFLRSHQATSQTNCANSFHDQFQYFIWISEPKAIDWADPRASTRRQQHPVFTRLFAYFVHSKLKCGIFCTFRKSYWSIEIERRMWLDDE